MSYMVLVCGRGEPTHEHATMSEAVAEAERLALLVDNRTRRIQVLEIVNILEPAHSHQWLSALTPPARDEGGTR